MILCCGEALIDMIPREQPDGCIAYLPLAGGAVFNTALALGRLEREVGLLTGLSRDDFARILRAALEAANVSADLAVVSDRPTTLAFVHLEQGQARYAFYDENSAARMIRREDLPELPETVDALFFGGISLAEEPCGEAYAALLERAGSRRVMIDPNIRPGFISDERRYRARLARMLARADVVKVSDEDLDWLAPGPEPRAEKASALLEAGAGLVLITRGENGVEAHRRGREPLMMSGRKVAVIDTVGAGDTFNAGFLAGLAQTDALAGRDAIPDDALEIALTLGLRAAEVTVGREGADPPHLSDLG
jgi:fructokinase